MTEPIAIDPGTLWDEIYKTDVDIHAQNNYISFSYLKALPGTMQDHVFGASNTLLEVACGPGMISARLASEYPSLQILGTDISPRAIEYAAENFKLPNLKYAVLDIRAVAGQWDIILAANILEHTFNPYDHLERLRSCARHVIILVPWNEPSVWAVNEFTSSHCRVFLDGYFNACGLLEEWKFDSQGWMKGDSRQWAILLKGHQE